MNVASDRSSVPPGLVAFTPAPEVADRAVTAREPELLPAPAPHDDDDCLIEPEQPGCGVPETPGSAALNSGFDAVAGKARKCGSSSAAMIGTKVEIRVSIEGSTGKVVHVEATGTHADTPLGKCVEGVVAGANFGVFKRSEYATDHAMTM